MTAGSPGAELCLTFDNMGRARDVGAREASLPDDADPSLVTGYPRILAMLDGLGLKGTFFIEGWNALHHPGLIREIAARGHEVGLHGWTHEAFGTLDRRTVEQLVSDGLAAMRNIGVTPTVFRAPGGLRGPFLQAVLEQFGFIGDSSVDHSLEEELAGLAVDTQPRLLSLRLANVPWRWDMIDYIHYRRLHTGPDAPGLLERRWIAALDAAEAAGRTWTPIVHAFVSGVEDARLAALERVLAHARRRPKCGSRRSARSHAGCATRSRKTPSEARSAAWWLPAPLKNRVEKARVRERRP